MNVIVVSTSKEDKKAFSPLKRSRKYSLAFILPKDLTDRIKKDSSETLYYLNESDFSDTDFKKKISLLEKNPHVRFGIIDRKNRIEDIAELFHKGAVDYVGTPVLKNGIEVPRITKVLQFQPFDTDGDVTDRNESRRFWNIVENGWKDIRRGKEYTFFLLYIELDMIDEWKQKSGKAHIDEVQKIFHRHIENALTAVGGKTWMWMNQGGVFLFPFNGKTCDPVLTCIRFVLNRTIISIEEFGYNSTISYKMALHLGNTVYKERGNTGEIVSDTVNFLFHLGQQYTRPGHFYVTAPIMQFIPDGLKKLFLPIDDFEGEAVFSMRLPKE